ncbi:MAG TPA: helix-hairpin-helix domain-containing protein [Candidatus Limnocylindrales bacterium]|nr:helix-hairpin-helix domain-containing protein [Candidatus Limnocylindrales bacterium]
MADEAAPWRALEAPAEPATATVADGARRSLALGGFVVAAVLGIVAFALAATAGTGSVAVTGAEPLASDPRASGGTAAGGAPVIVEVAGAVRDPGVYKLHPGARVADAVAAAGGYGPRLDAGRASQMNLAATVKDGDRVHVPSRDDPRSTSAGSAAPGSESGGGLVDVNHATADQLDALPGIGPATAAKILAARDEQSFASVDDFAGRKVVGASTMEKIRALITTR